MKIVDVLIERNIAILNRPFTYLYDGTKTIDIGFRVLICFGSQEIVGYVVNCKNTDKSKNELEEEMGFTINYINDVLDQSALLNEELLKLSDMVADYYMSSKISVLQSMLPPSLSPRKSSLKAPKIAYENIVRIIDDNEIELTNKQIELLRFIKSNGEVRKKDITQKSILDKLVELNKLEIFKREKQRLELPNYCIEEPKQLTKDQKRVISEFINSDDKTFLLQGVTGSGKTEVYLSLCDKTLKEGRNVLMLVPEISLTPVMIEYFLKRFKNQVAIFHSELTPAERYDQYRKISRNECSIVVGARSAIFVPLSNIGLIILDEEHVESYKQDCEPFYHARDVAIMRSNYHNCKLLLGSATPSLESRARAQNGLYHLLRLNHRINQQELPETHVINMLNLNNIDRNSYIFSKKLRLEIKDRLDKKEQIILLLNRRGFSTNLSCRNCGYVFKCPNCGMPLIYHKNDGMLKCHHCDHVEVMPESCPDCGSSHLLKTGFGVERVEEEVSRLFPDATSLRLDSDSAKIRTRVAKTIEDFRNHKADILIGTQMIAKGHDFPLVTLVGVVLADIGLNMPSYKSSERAFQLITQAVGRAGRNDKKGVAYIQTYLPNHYAITMAARQDYDEFYHTEMNMRKLQHYPPYYYLISVSVAGKDENKVIDEIIFVTEFLKDNLPSNVATILGPTTPYISYDKNCHIRSCLIKYRNEEEIRKLLINLQLKYQTKSNIKLIINIDPYNF